MSEELRTGIAFVLSMTVLIMGYIKLFRKTKSKTERFIERAKSKKNFTSAKIVDSKIRLGNDASGSDAYKYDSYKVKYEYSVNGVTYTKKLVFQSKGTVSVKYPYEITVYYDPGKPQKCICREEINDNAKSIGCLGHGFIAALVFMVVYNFLKLF